MNWTALSFLQVVDKALCCDEADEPEFYAWLQSKHFLLPNRSLWYAPVVAFYQQEFKTELITELFKGWEIYEFVSYFDKKGNVIRFDLSDKSYFINEVRIVEYPKGIIFPRTLDDFITDFQRVSVELTWKEKS